MQKPDDDVRLTRRALIAAGLMATASVAGQALVPTKHLSALRADFKLESLVPEDFGTWKLDRSPARGIINPETEALLNRIYSQQLNRVYLDGQGHRIMLAIAYGDDQSDNSVQMHYPEVCYPAQGFQVRSARRELLKLPQGEIKVKRLETQLGDARPEPVTYWVIIGDQQVADGWDKKLSEIRHGFHGEIVDGLLFRVSSIDRNATNAFQLQDAFVRDLIAAMSAPARRQLVGLSAG